MTLTEFLLARLAEDEAAARAAEGCNGQRWRLVGLVDGMGIRGEVSQFSNPGALPGDENLWDDEGALGIHPETASHIVRHDPARVLAECAAKRAVIDAAWEDHVQIDYEWGHCQTREQLDADDNVPAVLIALATVHADHPDYRPEWST